MRRLASRFFSWVAACMLLPACSLGAPTLDSTPAFAGPPQAHIAAPLPGQTFLAGAKVIVQARIDNAGPDLARVSVWLDDTLLGEEAQPNPAGAAILPLTIDWRSGEAGEYTISVEAQRGDGEITRESVTVFVISDMPRAATPTPVEIHGGQLPGILIKPANLRTGPGAGFDLVTNMAANELLEIVGRDQAGEWYQLRHADAAAWVYADMVEVDGDPSILPLAGAHAMPASEAGWVNLIVDAIELAPNPLVCGQPGKVIVRIRNQGDADTSGGGFIEIRDSSNGEESGPFQQVFGPVRAGGSVSSQGANITIKAGAGMAHTLRAEIDSGGMIAESDEGDNSAEITYTLAPGSCA